MGGVGAETLVFAIFDFDLKRWRKASFLEACKGEMRNERLFFSRDIDRSEHSIHFRGEKSKSWRSFDSDPGDAGASGIWKKTDAAKFKGQRLGRADDRERITNSRNFF